MKAYSKKAAMKAVSEEASRSYIIAGQAEERRGEAEKIQREGKYYPFREANQKKEEEEKWRNTASVLIC